MKSLIGTRSFAVIAVVIICVVSAFANSSSWLDGERKPVIESLKSEVNDKADLANDILRGAKKHVASDKTINELESSISAVRNAKSAGKLLSASNRLDAAVAAVVARLKNVDMGDDSKYRDNRPIDMDSINSRIRTGTYNEAARNYNDKLKDPLYMIMRIAGLAGELPLAK